MLSRVTVALSLLLLLMPLVLAPHWPLLDAPGHEARLAILHNMAFSKTHTPFYEFDTLFLPNIAFDLVGFVLALFVSPESAAKIFFGMTVLLTVSGVAALNRTIIGRWSPAPFAAALAAYHLVAILGFLSYTFGLALVLWLLAIRIRVANSSVLEHVIGTAGATVLLFCHIFDFGIYAVMLGGFTLAQLLRRQTTFQRAILNGLELLPAALLFIFMSTLEGTHPPSTFSLSAKLFGIVKAMSAGSITADLAFLTGAACYVALLIMCFRVRLASVFVPGLVMLAALYFIIPNWLASGAYIDSRLPIAIVFLTLAGLDLQWRERQTAAKILIATFVGALVVKQVAITVLWRSFTASIDQITDALNKLPAGSVVMTSECKPGDNTVLGVYYSRQPAMTLLASRAAFDNTRFVARVFAVRGQQPIRVSDQFIAYYQLQQKFESTCDLADYSARISQIQALEMKQTAARKPVPQIYLFLVRPPKNAVLTAQAKLVKNGTDFSLYRILPKEALGSYQ